MDIYLLYKNFMRRFIFIFIMTAVQCNALSWFVFIIYYFFITLNSSNISLFIIQDIYKNISVFNSTYEAANGTSKLFMTSGCRTPK